jgi:hypothetical protein
MLITNGAFLVSPKLLVCLGSGRTNKLRLANSSLLHSQAMAILALPGDNVPFVRNRITAAGEDPSAVVHQRDPDPESGRVGS